MNQEFYFFVVADEGNRSPSISRNFADLVVDIRVNDLTVLHDGIELVVLCSPKNLSLGYNFLDEDQRVELDLKAISAD